jgi:hypothetical protein
MQMSPQTEEQRTKISGGTEREVGEQQTSSE